MKHQNKLKQETVFIISNFHNLQMIRSINKLFYGKICAVADVAQLAEHITRNNEVMGSIPIIGSIGKFSLMGEFFIYE